MTDTRHPLPSGGSIKRALYFSLVVLTTLATMLLLSVAFQSDGLTPLELALLVLYAVLMLWISASFWTATIGFLSLLLSARHAPHSITSKPGAYDFKNALVMPIHNEDPRRIFAGLRAMYRSLAETGRHDSFEIFVLSDTRDPDIWIEEERLWLSWVEEIGAPVRVFYRHRTVNSGRKSGNLAQFVRSWGGRYRYMIVLDADSIMSGRTLVEMVDRMEADPQLALLQTVPTPVNRSSLFARMLQFAGHLYGRMFATGLAFWQQDAANYWGHNSIIRVEAFANECALPRLPGREPFGGDILSHDFVEAALLVRAGWKVRLAYDLEDSYEELPPTLIDYAKRDRRWCQGNLQHARLIFAHGFKPLSRVHFAMGVMSYLASPLWLIFLVVTAIEAYLTTLRAPVYFFGHNLLPIWPENYVVEMTTVLWVTLGFLFLPKLLALVLLAADKRLARQFGGLPKASLSVAIESLVSVLVAPVLMLFQSKFVASILLRKTIGWPTQQRGDHQTGLAEALRVHGGQTLLGVAVGYVAYHHVPSFFWWFTPVLAGLLLSIPISMLTSRVAVGTFAKRLGLFLTPAETSGSGVLELLDNEPSRPKGQAEPEPVWTAALSDPRLFAMHDALLQHEPLNRRQLHLLKGLILQLEDEGADSLSDEDKRALLSHREGVGMLHTTLWAARQDT